MNILIVSPPYILGTRTLIPDSMAIVTNFLKYKGHIVNQIDLHMVIEKYNSNFFFNKINQNPFSDEKFFLSYINYFKKNLIYYEIQKMINLINLKKKRIVFFSIHSYSQFYYALALSKFIKIKYNKKIVMGGAFFNSVDIKYLFNKFNFIDIICVGRIDNVYKELMKNLKKNNRKLIIKNKLKNKLLFPDYSGLDLENYKFNFNKKIGYKKTLTIQTSEGCPHNCNFCNATNNREFISYNPKDIIKLIKFIKKKYNINNFFFTNQYININYQKTEKLLDEIIKNNLNINWISYVRPEKFDKNMLIKFYKSGCIHLSFGLESASKKVLKLMNKKYDLNNFKLILKKLYLFNITTNVNFIIGYPGEKNKNFLKTLNFIKNYGKFINKIQILYLYVLYGSNIYKNKLIKYNYPKSFYSIIVGDFPIFYSKKDKQLLKKKFYLANKFSFKYVIRKEVFFLKFIPFYFYYYFYVKKLYLNYYYYYIYKIINIIFSINKLTNKYIK